MAKSKRVAEYGKITIWKNFDDEIQPAEKVEREITLVENAIDEGWFDGYDSIKIVGTAHLGSHDMLDDAHLTLRLVPGKSMIHLYILPNEPEITTNTTITRATHRNARTGKITTLGEMA